MKRLVTLLKGKCWDEEAKPRLIAGTFFRADVDETDAATAGTCLSENDTDDSTTATPMIRWKSTDTLSFYRNQPLLVSDPDKPAVENEAVAYRNAMQRSRELPKSPGYFSSNHVLVNLERRHQMIAPLSRLSELDELARSQAEAMASENRLFHSDPESLQAKFSRRRRIMGENVACGKSIRDIHAQMIEDRTHRGNILQRRYTHFGMGTARSKDGKKLFLCQIFRG